MLDVSVAQYLAIQQFYYREARLLDERLYQQWFALLSPEIAYTVPARHVPMRDNALRETEAFLGVEAEFSSGMAPPLRAENHLHLMIRSMRAYKMNAWADNPPARTRRHVNNIEVFAVAEYPDTQWQVYSNTWLYYSRREDHVYSYQRKDILKAADNTFCLLRREVLLDNTVVAGPSAGLFF